MRQLGARLEAVRLIGNLKYDAAELDRRRTLNVPLLLQQLGLPNDALILVAGSTHRGEEKLLGTIYLRMRQLFPKLFLIVVPRHQERGNEVGRELRELNIRFVFRSELSRKNQFKPGAIECLLVNTTGELKYFYEQATVIFIGKSLTAVGGQNPIEAGILGKPMVFGPNMQNFAGIAEQLVSAGGAIQVADAAGLEGALEALLRDPKRREEAGEKALKVVRDNQGAMTKTLDMIIEHLQGGEIYVAR